MELVTQRQPQTPPLENLGYILNIAVTWQLFRPQGNNDESFTVAPTHCYLVPAANFQAILTVCDCRFWLASITAVRGTVSSNSSLPGAGFSRKDILEV